MKGGSGPKKGTAQPCQRGVNVDHEKSLGNCLYDGIDIYIYIYIYIYIRGRGHNIGGESTIAQQQYMLKII